MSATREYRNAGRVDDAISKIEQTVDEASDLLNTLAGHLPDDYPWQDVADALEEVRCAHKQLEKVAAS